MKTIYLPSNRQRKALLVQGQPIQLAMPAPPGDVDDPVDWTKSVLPSDLRQYVRSAEEMEVLCHRGMSPPTNLTQLLGQINEQSKPGIFGVCIVAVVATLSPARPRHGALPIQWPQNVEIDGKPLFGEEKS